MRLTYPKSKLIRTLVPSTRFVGLTSGLLFFALNLSTAQAAVTISEIRGASRVVGIGETTTTPDDDNEIEGIAIFGGTAGSDTAGNCANKDNVSTCDNCADNGLSGNDRFVPCNSTRIYSDLRLVITFVSNKSTGRPAAEVDDSNRTTIDTVDSNVTVNQGSTAVVQIPWRNICSRFNGNDSSCGTAFDGWIRVGISTNSSSLSSAESDSVRVRVIVKSLGSGTSIASSCDAATITGGICYFEMGSGDKKAVVKKLTGVTGTDELNYRAVRFLYSTVNFTDIRPGSPYQDLDIEGEATNLSASPSRITGLQNDVEYFFKTAVIDDTGNVGYFTPDSLDEDCSQLNPPDTRCHRALPSEVAGVLSESGCFIATAAYGSPMAPQVNMFRQFRDRYLLVSDWGIKLVGFYYEHSPKYAKIIAENEALRFVSRAILWPVLAWATFTVQYGVLFGILILAATLGSPFALWYAWSKRSIWMRGHRA